jgi:hypothetical protein
MTFAIHSSHLQQRTGRKGGKRGVGFVGKVYQVLPQFMMLWQ